MAAREDGSASLSKIGGFANAEGSGAESTAYDAVTNRLFVGNTEANRVDVLSLADPGSPQQVLRILMPSGLENHRSRFSREGPCDGAGEP